MNISTYSNKELGIELKNLLIEKGLIEEEAKEKLSKPSISLIDDLSLDSIKLLEYLLAIENRYHLQLDYSDLNVELFNDFDSFTAYFYTKIQNKFNGN